MKAPSTASVLARDLVLDVVRFPLWWYTTGVARAARFAWGEVREWSQRLSLVILFRNLLKPMYGDYSRSGRIISLFLRLLVFAVKLVVMVIWIGAVTVLFLVWLAVPIGVGWLFVRSLGG